MQLGQDHQRGSCSLLKSNRGDGSAVAAFFIGPDEARIRVHFEILSKKFHRLWEGSVAQHQSVSAPDTNIHLAGKEGHAGRFWNPPLPEEFRISPSLKDEADCAVEGPGNGELKLRLPLNG